MELTDKCKVEFEKWFSIDEQNERGLSDEQIKYVRINKIEMFYDLSNSMQYGVLVDFFDKVGLEMTDFKWRGKFTAALYIDDDMKISDQIGKDKGFKKRDDARIFIVKKTNDYYDLNEYNYELE